METIVYNPLFPEINKSVKVQAISKTVEIEKIWALRKGEINKILNEFLNQRTHALKAYEKLTIENANAIASIRSDIKNISSFYGEKYILSLLAICNKCSNLISSESPQYALWSTRFNKITKYCNDFIAKFNATN